MSKEHNLTNKEMEDLESIVSDTLARLCEMADKHNIDRNSLVKYYANVITGIAEFATIQNCETNHTNADKIMNMCDFEEMQHNEKQIRKTSVRTKEIVYRFSVLSDRDKDRIISKFRSIKYSKEQNIEILLDQLAQNRLEEEFLNTIKSYGEDIMAMALEKQIPKKPTPIDYEKYIDVINNARSLRGAYWCPNCKHVVKSGSFCSDCGQKLDWSNEE